MHVNDAGCKQLHRTNSEAAGSIGVYGGLEPYLLSVRRSGLCTVCTVSRQRENGCKFCGIVMCICAGDACGPYNKIKRHQHCLKLFFDGTVEENDSNYEEFVVPQRRCERNLCVQSLIERKSHECQIVSLFYVVADDTCVSRD